MRTGRVRLRRGRSASSAALWVLALALALATLAGCRAPGSKSPRASARTGFALGTLVQVRAYPDGEKTREALDRVFARIEEIESLMSTTIPSSDIERLREKAGGLPIPVSDDTLYVVKRAKEYGDLSHGKFDVAIGPLVETWGIGTDHARVPSPEEIETARKLVDHTAVEVDESAGTVRLPKAGMALDLGAIAKGFAADEAALVLTEHGVKSGFIDLGGNIFAVGSKPDGSPWRVGIQDPWRERGATFAVLSVRDMAVVTSGTYERFFERDGKRYHHIIDPDTGYPAETGVESVTIVTRSAVDADALSTTVFLLGPSNGMELVTHLPGVEAVLLTDDRQVIVSPGLRGVIEVSSGWAVKYYDVEDTQES